MLLSQKQAAVYGLFNVKPLLTDFQCFNKCSIDIVQDQAYIKNAISG